MGSESTSYSRETLVDRFRGVGILMVLLGHSIQFANGEKLLAAGAFLDGKVFAFIYGVHMPLLIVISGYLFSSSLRRKSWGDLVRSRCYGILLPIISWGVIDFVVAYSLGYETPSIISKSFVRRFAMDFWFLWSVFFLSIASIVLHRSGRYKYILFALMIILFFITPDKNNANLHKYLFPYFVGAAVFLDEPWARRLIGYFDEKRISVFCVSLIVYLAFICFWKREDYIYMSGMSLLDKAELFHQCAVNIYRWVAGLVGIVAFAAINLMIPRDYGRALCILGRHSLAVYIFSGILYLYIIPVVFRHSDFSVLRTLVITLVVMSVSIATSVAIKKNRIINLMLLGGRL